MRVSLWVRGTPAPRSHPVSRLSPTMAIVPSDNSISAGLSSPRCWRRGGFRSSYGTHHQGLHRRRGSDTARPSTERRTWAACNAGRCWSRSACGAEDLHPRRVAQEGDAAGLSPPAPRHHRPGVRRIWRCLRSLSPRGRQAEGPGYTPTTGGPACASRATFVSHTIRCCRDLPGDKSHNASSNSNGG